MASTISGRTGWVSVGIDHDTARSRPRTIRRWWQKMGRPLPGRDAAAHHRGRRRQQRLPGAAVEAGMHSWPTNGLTITCAISRRARAMEQDRAPAVLLIPSNWRGAPADQPRGHRQPIGATTTAAGAPVEAVLDTAQYPAAA